MRPGPTLILLLLLWLVTGIGAFFDTRLIPLWAISGLYALLPVAADFILARFFQDSLEALRSVAPTLAINEPAEVSLSLSRTGHGFLSLSQKIYDLYPQSMECNVFPHRIRRRDWQGEHSLVFTYRLRPLQRGTWEFGELELLQDSPLKIWRRKVCHTIVSQGKTYPDFKAMLKPAAAELKGITIQSGLKNSRRRGQGLEFLNLREYREGDSIRFIDWRATSRRGKPIVREYTEDRDQQVLFLIDSGYRLHRKDGSLLQFDLALNAILMLSYVALAHGDSVAVASFGNDERWFPPGKGKTALNRLMNRFYDLESAAVPSSPFAALENALKKLKKRTFIVLVSNFREEDGESLSWILPHIGKKHLLLAVSLLESDVGEITGKKTQSIDDMLEKAAAHFYIHTRENLYRSWERLGLLTLETPARDLSTSLVNSYLDVKRSGRL